MTVRAGGFLISRGMAVFFLAQSVASALSSLSYVGSGPGYGWRTVVPLFAVSIAYFLVAGMLWRGADRFADDAPSNPSSGPIDERGLFRVLVAGIAGFWIFDEANLLGNQIASAMTAPGRLSIWAASLKTS